MVSHRWGCWWFSVGKHLALKIASLTHSLSLNKIIHRQTNQFQQQYWHRFRLTVSIALAFTINFRRHYWTHGTSDGLLDAFLLFLPSSSEPNSKVIKTTTTYTSRQPVSRELVFDSPENSSLSRSSFRSQGPSTYETRTIESNVKKNVSYTDDGLYGKPRRTLSPVSFNDSPSYVTETSRTRTITPTPVAANTERYITETHHTLNNEIIPSKNVKGLSRGTICHRQIVTQNLSLGFISVNEVIRVENSTGPNALRDFQLSEEILPKPKTKVTTTVR